MKSTALLTVALLTPLAVLGCKENKDAHDHAHHGSMATGQMKQGAEVMSDTRAMATLAPAAAQKGAQYGNVKGSVKIWEAANVVTFAIEITGLTPNTTHGFHVHQSGDLSHPALESAGPHWDPHMTNQHGGPMDHHAHAGDLGNVASDGNGMVKTTVTRTGITVKDLIGKSVILHDKPDDLKSNPAGNSGARIAGGVIRPQ